MEWANTEQDCKAEAERKELLRIYRAVTKLVEIEWKIGLARVTLARKCAAIAKQQTELHNLQLLAHRCEDCSRPLHERVDGIVKKRKNANAHVCGVCATRRKAESEAGRRKALSKET